MHHYRSEGRRYSVGIGWCFLLVVWHYLRTIKIAANKGVPIFIHARHIRRGKKWHYLHTIDIGANKSFRIFLSVP